MLYCCYSYEHQNGQCILDLLEYYVHTNHKLSAILGRTSQRLHELEVENQSEQPSQS